MSEETAKALIEALNRFAAAVEAITGPAYIGGKAIQVHHSGHVVGPMATGPAMPGAWGPPNTGNPPITW